MHVKQFEITNQYFHTNQAGLFRVLVSDNTHGMKYSEVTRAPHNRRKPFTSMIIYWEGVHFLRTRIQ